MNVDIVLCRKVANVRVQPSNSNQNYLVGLGRVDNVFLDGSNSACTIRRVVSHLGRRRVLFDRRHVKNGKRSNIKTYISKLPYL